MTPFGRDMVEKSHASRIVPAHVWNHRFPGSPNGRPKVMFSDTQIWPCFEHPETPYSQHALVIPMKRPVFALVLCIGDPGCSKVVQNDIQKHHFLDTKSCPNLTLFWTPWNPLFTTCACYIGVLPCFCTCVVHRWSRVFKTGPKWPPKVMFSDVQKHLFLGHFLNTFFGCIGRK